MEQIKDIRSLRRGLAILDVLSRIGPSSLATVVRETGLPKSTTRRILATLEETGYARRNLGGRLFHSNIGPVGGGHQQLQKSALSIVKAAKPVLEQMSREVVWPSDLFIRDGNELQIVETTRLLTPLLVNRNEIGDRVDMLTTAVGRAYLAFCPAAEREELLQALMHGRPQPEIATLNAVIADVKKSGFAVRDPRCTGATAQNPLLIDRLYAIAVPVTNEDKVACCINMLWPVSATSSVGDEKAMVQMLKARAAEISVRLQKAQGQRTT